MNFFYRTEIAVRCASRSTTLVMPDRDRLLDACERRQRRRLQHCLAKQSDNEPSWAVQWEKSSGDALRAQDVVAVLRCDQVTVELVYAQKGILAETFVTQGARVAMGTQLARLERRAKPAAAPVPEPPTRDILRQFVARQRSDAETIKRLEAGLAEYQQAADLLRSELQALRARLVSGGASAADPKFRQLKHEFSKRFHPDARPSGDSDRALREWVFREFWPIVERIERS